MATDFKMPQTPAVSVRQPAPAAGERKATPVKWWAAVGAFCVALTLYEWTAWIVRGHAHAAPKGPTEPETWVKVSMVIWQILFGGGALVLIYLVVIRPWRKKGALTFDGMFLIAWFSAWAMQDSWFNYSRQWFNYSSLAWNLGCPQCEVPGWQTPNGHLQAEPIIFVGGLYICALFTGCILCNALMRKAKARWPRLGTMGLVGVAFAAMAIADIVLETLWARTGTYSYIGGIHDWSIFGGHYYQYPVTQALIWGGPWALIACMRYFKNDRGETLAERGVSQLRIGTKGRQSVRLLAVIGMLNTLFFVFSNIPNQWFGLHADNIPADAVNKSYLTNMMCGPGTDYACPGPRVPMPVGPDSAHLRPEGTFDAPKGVPNQTGGGTR